LWYVSSDIGLHLTLSLSLRCAMACSTKFWFYEATHSRLFRGLPMAVIIYLCAFPSVVGGAGPFLRSASKLQMESSSTPGFVSLMDSSNWIATHSASHTQVSDEYLRRNSEYALRARQEIPAVATVSDQMFLREVLPYQHFDEPIDEWRPLFFEKLKPQVEGADSLKALAEKVIPLAFTGLGNTLEFKSNQTPGVMAPVSQTLKLGYASCTGMSILVADALRSVGVPARIAGIAEWNRPEKGNHNWVEVWTGDGWHFIDAVPTTSVEWDKTWFSEGLVQSSEGGGLHGVYTPVWDVSDSNGNYTITWRDPAVIMPALDRTPFYKALTV